jgi:hypothetical protein
MRTGAEKSKEMGMHWDRGPSVAFMGRLDEELRRDLVHVFSYMRMNHVEEAVWNRDLGAVIRTQFDSLLRGFSAWEGL